MLNKLAAIRRTLDARLPVGTSRPMTLGDYLEAWLSDRPSSRDGSNGLAGTMTRVSTIVPVVVMGVSGSGKSTACQALEAVTGRPFKEGDVMHRDASVAKMRAGVPLTDMDRGPWLDAVAAWLARVPEGIVACSALRRMYRNRLQRAAPHLYFVHIHAASDLLHERLGPRHDHFMPRSLLDSQLQLLEPVGPGEHGVVLDAARPALSLWLLPLPRWLRKRAGRRPRRSRRSRSSRSASAPVCRSPPPCGR